MLLILSCDTNCRGSMASLNFCRASIIGRYRDRGRSKGKVSGGGLRRWSIMPTAQTSEGVAEIRRDDTAHVHEVGNPLVLGEPRIAESPRGCFESLSQFSAKLVKQIKLFGSVGVSVQEHHQMAPVQRTDNQLATAVEVSTKTDSNGLDIKNISDSETIYSKPPMYPKPKNEFISTKNISDSEMNAKAKNEIIKSTNPSGLEEMDIRLRQVADAGRLAMLFKAMKEADEYVEQRQIKKRKRTEQLSGMKIKLHKKKEEKEDVKQLINATPLLDGLPERDQHAVLAYFGDIV